ncbi:CRISPR-associated endonuclease Cas2 [Tepidibacillus decaturensis]|uniref:CRISPR-associated endoribonuclease Cas2 n=1 Tax=Tepidibacillus decaturensis TaxID=1413211 RepID=A0A135L2H6_9BACI|nr:CRISPR-associated endonuclease Cas2 [Tepidibacillus decaturensis]KXG43099.1 CRISPR-associated protein Cas2 [Tepidibacillus decaturensis]
MFVILVYDVGEKRVNKVLKKCREYLTWVQNSVLEGELSEGNLKKLKFEIGKIIKTGEDSVIIYSFQSTKYSTREVMGLTKNSQDIFV